MEDIIIIKKGFGRILADRYDRAAAASMTTGQSIRAARQLAGLSQSALGARLGMKQSRIGDIERERNGLTVDTLKRIATALGVEPGFLIGE